MLCLRASRSKSSWNSLSLSGCSAARSVSEAEIVPHVVELPDILFERLELFGGVSHTVQAVAGASPPAFVVDGTAAGQLEVLRRVPVLRPARRQRCRACSPLRTALVDAVDALRLRQPDALQDRRRDVDQVVELPAPWPPCLDAYRPGDRGGGAATRRRSHHFAVVKGRGGGVAPGGGIAAVGVRAAEVVHPARPSSSDSCTPL